MKGNPLKKDTQAAKAPPKPAGEEEDEKSPSSQPTEVPRLWTRKSPALTVPIGQVQGVLGENISELSVHHLAALKEGFMEADEDGSGALDIEEFVEAFSDAKNSTARSENSNTLVEAFSSQFPSLSERELRHLFAKIDANADGEALVSPACPRAL